MDAQRPEVEAGTIGLVPGQKQRGAINIAILRCELKVMFVVAMILHVEIGESVDSRPRNSLGVRNSTSVGTSCLDPRSENSGKIPQCRTGVFPHLSLKED